MLLESQYWPLREQIHALYPNSSIELAELSDGSPLYVRVSVAAGDVAALQGLTQSISYGDGRTTVGRSSSIEPPSDPAVTQAVWDGGLRLDRSGLYEFESGSGWQVALDDRPVSGEGFLGQGLYRLHVLWASQPGSHPPLRWRIDKGDWEALPSSLLFNVPGNRNGLMATYWSNPSWDGAPLFRQVTPFVWLAWPDGTLPTSAFSARLAGNLRITEAGSYEFQVEADDGARLFLDDQLVGEGLVPNQPNRFNVSMDLDVGDHPLRLDYVQFGGGNALRLMWRHADLPFEPVPPSALIPSEP